MKIALQVGTPEPEQLTAFMQELSHTIPILSDSLTAGESRIIAAYDCGKLVGLGSRIETEDQAPDLQVYIAPGYERRGIGENMRKLMLPGSSGSLVHAG